MTHAGDTPSDDRPTETGPAEPPSADSGRVSGGDPAGASPAPGGRAVANRLRRRRRLVVAGVSLGAGLLALALCAGLVAAVARLDRDRDERREQRRATDTRQVSCLELERRLNRLTPPGATPDAPARATAVRAENAALRPFLTELQVRGQGSRASEDGLAWWRQLLDARTAYAEALDRQAAVRTPAFFETPRTPRGDTVADRLLGTSPGGCAGPVRRLAAPDL